MGKLPLILALVNSAVVAGVLGTAFYTMVLFKRPEITESGERARLAEAAAPKAAVAPGRIEFKPVMFNIRPNPAKPGHAPASDSLLAGKQHYVQLGMSLEIRNAEDTEKFEYIRPIFLDELNHALATKSFDDLTTVQGRFLLRAEILELANNLIKEPAVTDVFFSQFVVQ